MTIGNSPLPYLRVRVVPRFPAIVQGANGTKVEKENGVFTIGPATGDLMEVSSVSSGSFVQVWDEQTDSYARTPSTAFVGGDGMAAAVYDPNGIAADAFSMANMVESASAKILTDTERAKLAGVATGATANSSDATLLARANHTGTQSADTLTDGTTNKAFLATERAKLTGIATGATANTGTVTSVAVAVPSSLTSSGGPLTTSGTITIAHASGYQGYTTTEATKLSGIATAATANSPDATLLARANHTGTQAASTITGLGAVATSNLYSDLTGLPTLGNVSALNYAASTSTFLRNDGTWAVPPGGGSGGGDMYAAIYDPNGVADDAFDMDNMAEGTTAKVFTASERTKLTGIEALADVTDAANVTAAGAFMKSVDDSDDLTEGTTKLLMTTAERSKLAGVATGATANSSDATLLARANHTGTQSADTLTDGTTNKAFLATERTKLSGIATGATANTGTVTSVAATVPTGLSVSGSAITTSGTLAFTWTAGYQGYTSTEATKLSGIATGATANSPNATLLARANHTGTQAASTITGLATVATTGAYADLTGSPVLRETLTANRTYYVRTDGSDSNDGLANNSGGAFLTLQQAWSAVLSIDLAGWAVTIKVADGTYTAGVDMAAAPVGGLVTIEGNTTTPANCIISTTGATGFTGQFGGTAFVKGFKVQTTTSGNGILASSFTRVLFSEMEFGACATNHLSALNYGFIEARSNYAISGGAIRHLNASSFGNLVVNNRTTTLSGTPAFTAFAYCDRLSFLLATGMTFSGTGATGQRYNVATGGIILCGGVATYFPGSTAGAAATGGQYL